MPFVVLTYFCFWHTSISTFVLWWYLYLICCFGSCRLSWFATYSPVSTICCLLSHLRSHNLLWSFSVSVLYVRTWVLRVRSANHYDSSSVFMFLPPLVLFRCHHISFMRSPDYCSGSFDTHFGKHGQVCYCNISIIDSWVAYDSRRCEMSKLELVFF